MSSAKNGPSRPVQLGEAATATPTPESTTMRDLLALEIQAAGGEIPREPELEGSIGTTMFDLPGSEDNTVTVVLPQQSAQYAA